jgi:hypothetical protein
MKQLAQAHYERRLLAALEVVELREFLKSDPAYDNLVEMIDKLKRGDK